ncbi:hypothetical protein VHEMI01489 [[Torrubiella] hemipterigena]|uniref:Uncharacterized protein n=1 Tax=[Torrubiella] hemipterigena TaxID=1531966 RepID=A0A0A1SM22_9HYPO|nr:hypothetical protein VHEMI01489 [[Torrubiella] hemipterigena]
MVFTLQPLAALLALALAFTSASPRPAQQQVLNTPSRPPATIQLVNNSRPPWDHQKPMFPHNPGQFTNGFIALGDSYSAGIGTSFNGTENDCRVGLHAYPNLIWEDLSRLRGLGNDSFQHLSCTGATIEDALAGAERSQVDNINITDAADFALLSIGGNDLGFFEIMNSCIFRFFSFYSGTCESAIAESAKAIASPTFDQHLRLLIMEILDRVRWEKKPWFSIFITGYARFFNAETDECDDHSLGVWWRGPKLKKELRQQMNDMVQEVNARIKKSVKIINAGFSEPRVFFIDYDDKFEGHRFCEPSVVEPDYTRNETWFFLVGGQDNGEAISDPTKVPMETPPDNEEIKIQNSMWYVPTYYGKTFHPRTEGHKAIQQAIYELWFKMYRN